MGVNFKDIDLNIKVRLMSKNDLEGWFLFFVSSIGVGDMCLLYTGGFFNFFLKLDVNFKYF